MYYAGQSAVDTVSIDVDDTVDEQRWGIGASVSDGESASRIVSSADIPMRLFYNRALTDDEIEEIRSIVGAIA